ncbi:hypothetical protein Scep_012519 [Stephania cephalantha]|uniref:Uncharacterized protein n=1 Tax=Stephania cephalantha TaxID=152367 RepID=A0AAP0JGM8_9MAGN
MGQRNPKVQRYLIFFSSRNQSRFGEDKPKRGEEEGEKRDRDRRGGQGELIFVVSCVVVVVVAMEVRPWKVRPWRPRGVRREMAEVSPLPSNPVAVGVGSQPQLLKKKKCSNRTWDFVSGPLEKMHTRAAHLGRARGPRPGSAHGASQALARVDPTQFKKKKIEKKCWKNWVNSRKKK